MSPHPPKSPQREQSRVQRTMQRALPGRHRVGASAVAARSSSAAASLPQTQALRVQVRQATSAEWWPASDAHCRVFNEAQQCPTRAQAAGAPPQDRNELQELGAWGLWAARRVDAVQALATNDALANRAGWGK